MPAARSSISAGTGTRTGPTTSLRSRAVRCRWLPGFHHRADGQLNYDPYLRLIHLHRLDIEVCRARHEIRQRRAWGERDLDEKWAAYNRIAGGDEFRALVL